MDQIFKTDDIFMDYDLIQVQKLKDEIINQRRKRDNNEMRQSKLRRALIRLNKTKDKSIEILTTNDKAKFIEQVKQKKTMNN